MSTEYTQEISYIESVQAASINVNSNGINVDPVTKLNTDIANLQQRIEDLEKLVKQGKPKDQDSFDKLCADDIDAISQLSAKIQTDLYGEGGTPDCPAPGSFMDIANNDPDSDEAQLAYGTDSRSATFNAMISIFSANDGQSRGSLFSNAYDFSDMGIYLFQSTVASSQLSAIDGDISNYFNS